MLASIPDQGKSPKTAARVSKVGKLKMMDVGIGDQMVPATIDTGAVKTLISASVV